ncbi:adenylate kinase [Exophiala xenobiotica]|nr:adenylate kinase [Exophiala xenobiotica]
MGVRTGHHEQVFRRTHSFSDHPRQSQRNWIAGRWGHEDKNHEAETAKRLKELKRRILAGVEEFDIESYRKSDRELKAINNKRVRAFYEAQNQKLDDWAEVDGLVGALADDVVNSTDPDADLDGDINTDTPLYRTNHDVEVYLPSEQRERRARNRRVAGRALNVNITANILLLTAKGIAVVSTQSLALIASLADSTLDVLCTAIIWVTSHLARRKSKTLIQRFPVGRRRLEPIGLLVFSILVIVSFAQILQESVDKLLPSGDHMTLGLSPVAIGAMGANIVLKGVVGLFYFKVENSQVQALVQDCYTDVYFNSATLLFPIIGQHLDIWWLDPLGAALLSLYVIYDWSKTSILTILKLCGTAVSTRLDKKLMYLAWRFSPVVDAYKSLTAYHAGDGILTEVDIVLDENTPLNRAHDIAQTMQYCFEGEASQFPTYLCAAFAEPWHRSS